MLAEERVRTVRKPTSSNGEDAHLRGFSQTPLDRRYRGTSLRPHAVSSRGSIKLVMQVQDLYDVDVTIIAGNAAHASESISDEVIKTHLHAIANELCQKHKGISMDESVLGGMPRLEGFRISVPNILTHLYHLGSIDAVVAEFEQRISKEQVKEAIAYAHDFMEMACDPSEDDD